MCACLGLVSILCEVGIEAVAEEEVAEVNAKAEVESELKSVCIESEVLFAVEEVDFLVRNEELLLAYEVHLEVETGVWREEDAGVWHVELIDTVERHIYAGKACALSVLLQVCVAVGCDVEAATELEVDRKIVAEAESVDIFKTCAFCLDGVDVLWFELDTCKVC